MAKVGGAVLLNALNATFAVQTDVQRVYTGNASPAATVGFDISNSPVGVAFVGTVVFEFTIDDTNWFPIAAHQTGPSGLPGPIVTSTTLAGRFTVLAGGYSQVRVRMSAYTSGTAAVSAAVTASQSEHLILRELMILNELVAQMSNGDGSKVDVNADYRSDPNFGP